MSQFTVGNCLNYTMKNEQGSLERLYSQHKSYLLSLAYRMLGSLAEAEELVHETFLEYQESSKTSKILKHKAWLTKVCTNKVLNHLKLAYKRRELYPGTWLPDEIPNSLQSWNHLIEDSSPEKKIILAESLTISFLLLIENLTPEQRVIYLLNEIFDYSFKEISEFIGKEISNCRKIAQRAREALSSDKKKTSPPPKNAEEIIYTFYELAKNGDREGLRNLLAKDSELWGDGGGKVYAAGHITNLDDSITFLIKLASTKIFNSNQYKFEYHIVSSRPGIVVSKRQLSGEWAFDTILSYEFYHDKIVRIYAQRNPDKLKSLLLSKSSV